MSMVEYLSYYYVTMTVECDDLGFKCEHGTCLTPDVRCNNNNDCGDHSDERHCCKLDRSKSISI